MKQFVSKIARTLLFDNRKLDELDLARTDKSHHSSQIGTLPTDKQTDKIYSNVSLVTSILNCILFISRPWR